MGPLPRGGDELNTDGNTTAATIVIVITPRWDPPDGSTEAKRGDGVGSVIGNGPAPPQILARVMTLRLHARRRNESYCTREMLRLVGARTGFAIFRARGAWVRAHERE